MLNIKPHTVTCGENGEAITLVFYPDTGCLRFADVLGVFHELRPPHSWIAISSASRGVCRGTHAMTEVLNTVLREFCASRPRWVTGPARVSVGGAATLRAPGHTHVHALAETSARAPRLAPVAPIAPVAAFGAGLQA